MSYDSPSATFSESIHQGLPVAWTNRRNDLQLLGNVGHVLSDVDRQIAELQQRVTVFLNAETSINTRPSAISITERQANVGPVENQKEGDHRLG